jgi:glycosyltransferase involved in cell wall biosynthesis
MSELQGWVRVPEKTVRLAYVVSHPIQYQEPLLRRLAREPGFDLTVYYSSDFSTRSYRDRGFGREVHWEIPLLQGYKYKILPRIPGTKNIYSAKPPSLGYLRQFLGGRYDVVWVHGYATVNSLHALMAARFTGAKTLVRTDSTLMDRERPAGKRALRQMFFAGLRWLVDGVLAVGTHNADYWRATLGPDVCLWTMPYAVDNEYFASRAQSATASREELRAELGLQPGRPVILFAAKLTQRKRCVDLLEAYALLTKEWLGGSRAYLQFLPYLLIVGDGAEGESLKRRAAEISSRDIVFAGFRSQAEIPRFYDLCDVFCLPSMHEPWGLAVNEAMACGCAVIVSDEVGCQPDLVRDGETGLVFKARHTQALAACLRRMLQEAGLAQRLAEAGRARIATWDFEADVCALQQAIVGLKVEGRKPI